MSAMGAYFQNVSEVFKHPRKIEHDSIGNLYLEFRACDDFGINKKFVFVRMWDKNNNKFLGESRHYFYDLAKILR